MNNNRSILNELPLEYISKPATSDQQPDNSKQPSLPKLKSSITNTP